MAGLDWAVLIILLLSMLVGALRGGVREIFALGAWVAAVATAWLYGSSISQLLPQFFARPETQLLIGHALTFCMVFALITLIAYLLRTLLNAAGLSALDRGLGIIFGLARAAIVVLVIGVIGGLSQFSVASWWRDAIVAPALETAVLAAKPWLPQAIAQRIAFKRTNPPESKA